MNVLQRSKVGQQVREQRMKLGWSQAELAHHSTTARQTVSRLETTSDCRFSTLIRVVLAMGGTLEVSITPKKRRSA